MFEGKRNVFTYESHEKIRVIRIGEAWCRNGSVLVRLDALPISNYLEIVIDDSEPEITRKR